MLSINLSIAVAAIGVTILTSALTLIFQGLALRRKEDTKVLGKSALGLGYFFFWLGLIGIALGTVRSVWLGWLLIILFGIGLVIVDRSVVSRRW